MKPSVGQIVHYVSYGTPGGKYTSQCRAAVITAVEPIAPPEAQMFFNADCQHDEVDHRGGTWHWPEQEI